MVGEKVLYEYLYQSILTQIYSGYFRFGQRLPSQQELCRQYNVGITTVRKVIRMLERDGFIETAERKRPTVIFQAEARSYIAVLKQRKRIILDMYNGMGYLLPQLHALGAMHYRSYKTLREIINGIHKDMEQRELFVQGSRFFLELLSPFNNQVLYDLQTDSENYTDVPYLPISGLEDQYSITPGQVKGGLADLLAIIQTKDHAALLTRLQQIFTGGYDRTKRYLEDLEKCCHSDGQEQSHHLVTGKNRAHLYTVIARRLYRRILDGEFRDFKYIPSVPELMKEYSVSQATALSAVALLNDIGAVRTLDKKGTVVISHGEKPAPLRMDRAVIGDNLILFLDALQILAVCSRNLAHIVLSGMEEVACREAVKLWDRVNPQNTGEVVRTLLNIFKNNAPCSTLKSFFEQLDYLLIWGHYMERDWAPAVYVDDKTAQYIDVLRLALAKRDIEAFAEAVHAIYALSFSAARQQMLFYGAAPEKLPASLEQDGIGL